MDDFVIKCATCGNQTPPAAVSCVCSICNGILDIEYLASPAGVRSMPVSRSITLGEGNTPVVELGATASMLGLQKIDAKLEYLAPTGSFKDRGSAILVAAAKEAGVKHFVEDSSGNAGASISAYAAKAGIKVTVFSPQSTSPTKLHQMRVFGAQLKTVAGGRHAATKAAAKFASDNGLAHIPHNLSPYFIEGLKSFVAELAGAYAYRHIVVPVGNGSLLLAAYKGFKELVESGRLDGFPHLHAVQSEACAPIVALSQARRWDPAEARSTVAEGIDTSSPPRGMQVVNAVSLTGGQLITVTDEAVLKWQAMLAGREGIHCEAAAAAAFAGLDKLVGTGRIRRDEAVLAPVTGTGMKQI